MIGWSDEYFSHSIHKISSSKNESHGCLHSDASARADIQPVSLIGTQPYTISKIKTDSTSFSNYITSLNPVINVNNLYHPLFNNLIIILL